MIFDINDSDPSRYIEIDGETHYFECEEDWNVFIRIKKIKKLKSKMNGSKV